MGSQRPRARNPDARGRCLPRLLWTAAGEREALERSRLHVMAIAEAICDVGLRDDDWEC